MTLKGRITRSRKLTRVDAVEISMEASIIPLTKIGSAPHRSIRLRFWTLLQRFFNNFFPVLDKYHQETSRSVKKKLSKAESVEKLRPSQGKETFYRVYLFVYVNTCDASEEEIAVMCLP